MTNVENLDDGLHDALAHYVADKGVDNDFGEMLSAFLQDKVP